MLMAMHISERFHLVYMYLPTSLYIKRRGKDNGMKGFHMDELYPGLRIKITLTALKENGTYQRTTQALNIFIIGLMTSGPSK
jgi:hypothetical protein